MTLISCEEVGERLQLVVMDDTPWQQRAKRAGLTQKQLAKLLGVAENTVSQQLRGRWASGIPQYVKTTIRAWEMLPQASREELSRFAESDDE